MADQSFDEWSPEERAQLAELGQHRSPRANLKARTIAALREQNLLGDDGASRVPRRWVLGLAAAATVVFSAGVLTGYGVAARRQSEARRDSAGSPSVTREVARADSVPSRDASGRHVIWF